MTDPTSILPPPPLPPAAPPLWKRTWVRVTAGVLVAVVTIGALTEEEESPTEAAIEASTTTTDKPMTTTTEPTTTTTRPTTTTTIDQMQVWAAAHLGEIEAVANQLTVVGDAAESLDVQTLTAECRALGLLIATAKQGLPVPDPDVNAAYSAALDDFGKGAAACVVGAATIDADLIEQANDLFLSGAANIEEATAAL